MHLTYTISCWHTFLAYRCCAHFCIDSSNMANWKGISLCGAHCRSGKSRLPLWSGREGNKVHFWTVCSYLIHVWLKRLWLGESTDKCCRLRRMVGCWSICLLLPLRMLWGTPQFPHSWPFCGALKRSHYLILCLKLSWRQRGERGVL